MNTNMANQIAAGFESLVPWVTVNKNVDRIIYVHYNFQNLTKLIRDAKGSLSEQLAATSQMILQNRTALYMVFAWCLAMFGSSCCTFIPKNTAPEGNKVS